MQNQSLNQKIRYEELTPNEFRAKIAEAPIAYLPLGTLEWHGEHLPLGADGLQSHAFFEILAREVGGIVLPMLFMGPDAHEMHGDTTYYGMDRGNFIRGEKYQYPRQQLAGSAYWLPDSQFLDLVDAILKQLKRAGFKIVVYHGHGPSTRQVSDKAAQWEAKHGLRLFNCWGEGDAEGLGIMVDHAAMNETSLIMYFYPELAQMENLPADSSQWPIGVGGKDPRLHASRKFGEKAVKLQAEGMIKLLKEALARIVS